jgi:hypothetical protein
MALEISEWDPESREIRCVERPFLSASSNGHDAAEKGGMPKEREEIGDEAKARVVI